MSEATDPIVHLFSRKEEATIASGITASAAREMMERRGFTHDPKYRSSEKWTDGDDVITICYGAIENRRGEN